MPGTSIAARRTKSLSRKLDCNIYIIDFSTKGRIQFGELYGEFGDGAKCSKQVVSYSLNNMFN